ncbi:unnamed protein product [Bubo scandiacus]
MAAPAASSSFLGLGPASRDPATVRRRSRGPRNRKKGWKRWAGPEAQLGREIGDFLEDVVLQQRATGGLIAEQPDEGLFLWIRTTPRRIDSGTRARRSRCTLTSSCSPTPRCRHPKIFWPIRSPTGGRRSGAGSFGKNRRKKGCCPAPRGGCGPGCSGGAPPEKTLEKGRSDPTRDFYDIWAADSPQERALAGQDPWFLQQTKKKRVKRPARLQAKPSPVPAVEVIAAGGSYNPAFEDHQALLLRAHEVEVRKKRAEDRVERQLKIPAGTELPTAETVFQEQCEGLVEESEEEEDEAEDAPKAVAAPRGGEEDGAAAAAGEGGASAGGPAAPGEGGAVPAPAAVPAAGAAAGATAPGPGAAAAPAGAGAKRRQREVLPRRLGRLRYEEPSLEVQLSDELPESLRTLKPEGSVLRDRFKSLQKRSLIEPRERAKFKRRYRLKYVEKRAFREVT